MLDHMLKIRAFCSSIQQWLTRTNMYNKTPDERRRKKNDANMWLIFVMLQYSKPVFIFYSPIENHSCIHRIPHPIAEIGRP